MSQLEPVMTAQVLKAIMDDLQKSLWATTPNYFTYKYQALQDVYLL